jgi:hypothetical protein
LRAFHKQNLTKLAANDFTYQSNPSIPKDAQIDLTNEEGDEVNESIATLESNAKDKDGFSIPLPKAAKSIAATNQNQNQNQTQKKSMGMPQRRPLRRSSRLTPKKAAAPTQCIAASKSDTPRPEHRRKAPMFSIKSPAMRLRKSKRVNTPPRKIQGLATITPIVSRKRHH